MNGVNHGADDAPPAKKGKIGAAPGAWGSQLAGLDSQTEEEEEVVATAEE